jgi:hypothetical protein
MQVHGINSRLTESLKLNNQNKKQTEKLLFAPTTGQQHMLLSFALITGLVY